jgi:hypothetical protein
VKREELLVREVAIKQQMSEAKSREEAIERKQKSMIEQQRR